MKEWLTQKHMLFALLGALALSFLLYGNTIGHGFVYDDSFFADRPELRNWGADADVWGEPYVVNHRAAGTYRPLTMASYALNFALFGDDPAVFHIINIALNGVVVFLVFILLQRMFGNTRLSLFTALFFGLLPIHTEAVVYIKAREELLAVCFMLLSWLSYFAGRGQARKHVRNMIFSSIFFMLAVFSKELFVAAPFAFLWVSYFNDRARFRELVSAFSYYVPAYAVIFFARWAVLKEYAFGSDDLAFVLNPIGHAEFATRFWTAFKLAFLYVGKTFVPVNLSATYHFNHILLVSNPASWEVMAGILLLAGAVYLCASRRFRKTPLCAGAVSFLALYAVISKFVFPAGDMLAERWMYGPSVGLAMAGGSFFVWLWGTKKQAAITLFSALAIVYGAVIVMRNRVWASDKTLYESMVRDAPQSLQGHQNLAVSYLEEGDMEAARAEIEKAFAIYPDHAPLLNLIGVVAFRDGNYELSEKAFLKAIEVRPELTISYTNIARLYYQTGEYQAAADYMRTAIENVAYPPEKDVLLYEEILKELDASAH